ncbi:MAG: hypothetical protein ACRDTG_00555, partial [Pseudonocardiaceae bacterium]
VTRSLTSNLGRSARTERDRLRNARQTVALACAGRAVTHGNKNVAPEGATPPTVTGLVCR